MRNILPDYHNGISFTTKKFTDQYIHVLQSIIMVSVVSIAMPDEVGALQQRMHCRNFETNTP